MSVTISITGKMEDVPIIIGILLGKYPVGRKAISGKRICVISMTKRQYSKTKRLCWLIPNIYR